MALEEGETQNFILTGSLNPEPETLVLLLQGCCSGTYQKKQSMVLNIAAFLWHFELNLNSIPLQETNLSFISASKCMYVCMYVCVCMCVHNDTGFDIDTDIDEHMCIPTYTHTHIYIYIQ